MPAGFLFNFLATSQKKQNSFDAHIENLRWKLRESLLDLIVDRCQSNLYDVL